MEITAQAVYRSGSHTCILVEIGRKNLRYIPMTDGEFSVKNTDINEFNRAYEQYDYCVVAAATKYIEYSQYHGITDKALGMLLEITKGQKRSTTAMATAKKEAAPKKEDAPKAAKKEVAPKKEAAPAKRGPRSAFEPTMKIRILAASNPKRGEAAERFKIYKNGMTIAKFVENGGRMDDLRFDVKKEFIKVE